MALGVGGGEEEADDEDDDDSVLDDDGVGGAGAGASLEEEPEEDEEVLSTKTAAKLARTPEPFLCFDLDAMILWIFPKKISKSYARRQFMSAVRLGVVLAMCEESSAEDCTTSNLSKRYKERKFVEGNCVNLDCTTCRSTSIHFLS